MPKSSFIDFKAIKAAITMEQLLQHYDLTSQFKRSGDSLSGPCPIHKGSNPTQFRVSVSKNVWNCFSECKNGGNVLDFIARMEKISIHAAAIKAIEWFDIDQRALGGKPDGDQPISDGGNRARETASYTDVKQFTGAEGPTVPNKPLKFRLDKLEREHPYLLERGLTLETIIDFGVGFCAKGMMADRIAIPIHSPDGAVVAYAGRCPGEPPEGTPKYKLPQGFRKSLELFNSDKAFKEAADVPLVVVEGFFDCMKLHQLGCRKVVALMGSTMSRAQEDLICKNVEPHSRVIIMLDEDEAGRASREDIAARIAKFAFTKIHIFSRDGEQPEHLGPDELMKVVA